MSAEVIIKKSCSIPVAVATVAVLATLLPGLRSFEKVYSQTPNTDERPIKEKAKGVRSYQENRSADKAQAVPSLTVLAQRSANIIIGIPRQNVSKLTPDGKSIVIEYAVSVEHVYKGRLKEGQTINVSVPGGRVTFADGTTAEVKTPWFRKMLNGKAYALFLGAARNQTYQTTGEAQGVFEIPTTKESRVVKVHSGVPGDPVWQYQNMEVMAFLREVKRAAKQ